MKRKEILESHNNKRRITVKKSKILGILMLVVFVALTLVFIPGCNNEKLKEPETIKIGAILPLTGNLGFIGEINKNGIELAVEDVNNRGGINEKKLQVIYEDSKSSPAEGVSAINKLINIDKINVIIVSTTNIASACAPVAENSKIIEIAMSPQPGIEDLGRYIFRIFPSSGQEAEVLAKYIFDNDFKKVSVLHSQDDYGTTCAKSFERYFKQYGREIVQKENYIEGQQDLKAQLLKIKLSSSDAIVMFGFGSTFPAALRQLKEQKMNVHVFGNMAFNNMPVKQLNKEEREGVVFTVPSFNLSQIQTEKSSKYIKNYVTKYKTNPDHSSAYFYDAVVLLAETIKRTGIGVESIRDELLKTKDFQGITGNISVEPNGDTKTSISLATYLNGNIEPVSR